MRRANVALPLVLWSVAAGLPSAAHAAASGPPVLTDAMPSGAVDSSAVPAWNPDTSPLVRAYPAPDLERRRLLRARVEAERARAEASGRASELRAARTRLLSIEADIRSDSLRMLVSGGLKAAAQRGPGEGRARALEVISSLRHPLEVRDAARILEGEGARTNYIESDPEVRKALFTALAKEPVLGPTTLVEFAIRGDDPLPAEARELLPRVLPAGAIAVVRAALSGPRERDINRAAMIAGAHPAASLIPALIQAQFAQTDSSRRGDEAWIAIGKSTTYVAGLVPVVGDASGAFQPIPGVVFEGSVLRIMESAVTIYRTEVHDALVATVEHATGQPAPPFGFDRERWLAWHRDEFPALAALHQRQARELEIAEGVRTSPPRADN